MDIQQNYENILRQIPADVTLIAVSKTRTVEEIRQLYDLGQRDFGENRIQEMVEKHSELPKDIRWHMIGPVQENKIKYMADFVHIIHGIDKVKRLKEIQNQAEKAGRIQEVLLQLHIAKEDTKFGMSAEEAEEILKSNPQQLYPNVRITGLMGMATFTEDMDVVRNEFRGLKNIFGDLQKKFPALVNLSMGMSGDFEIAIEEGSTMVRIGSAIFGERN